MNGKVSARIDQHISRTRSRGKHKQASRRQGVPWILWDSMDEHDLPLYMALNAISGKGAAVCRSLRPPIGHVI